MTRKGTATLSTALLCLAGVVFAQNVEKSGSAGALADQEQYVSYWTLEPNWHSELQLRNTSPTGDLLVRPSLRATDGSETALPAVVVHPNEVTDVNLHEAVMSLSRQPASLSGSMVLRYKAEDQGFLYAAMMVHRESRPIAFHIDAMGKFTDDKDYLREGVWWLPNDRISDYLVLTNQGDDWMPVVLSVFDAQGRSYQKEMTLLGRESKRLSVRELAEAGHLSGDFGGIQVHALAHARALDTLHVMFDEKAGFSATLKMFDHDPGALVSERDFAKKGSWTIRAPMLALAQPDPALLLPPFTELEPRLLLRNTKQKPVAANVVFNWRSAARTGKTVGPTIRLKPMETRMIKLSDLPSSEAPPSDAHWATVSISTDGAPDGIVAVAASYNSALTYGAQTPFSDQLSSLWKGGEWLADANHDSIITVGNASLKPMRARFSLLYSRGTARYEIEENLAPDEQMWVDVGEIIRTGKPDMSGRVLPKDLASGSYEFQDMTDRATAKLYEGKVIYDLLNGHVTYGCSVACCMIGSALTFSPLTLGLTTIATNGVQGEDNCGSGWYDISSGFYNWTTQTQSIAKTTVQGRHTGMSVGSTMSQTSGELDRPNGRFACIQKPIIESGPTNVISVSQSPAAISMSSGDTNQAITVTVSPLSSASSSTVSFGLISNKFSSSQASLAFKKPTAFSGNDPWNISVSGSNSASGIVSATACVQTACATQPTTITIPPQILVQMLNGEAGGQNQPGDMSQVEIGMSARNRFGDTAYFAGNSTYQNTLNPGQYYGLGTPNGQISNGVQPALNNAITVFLDLSDLTGGSECYWSPTSVQWAVVQQTLSSNTIALPPNIGMPQCYTSVPGMGPQIVYSSLVGVNTRAGAYAGAPAFVFVRPRNISGSVPPAAVKVN